jgi:hypothetical protein
MTTTTDRMRRNAEKYREALAAIREDWTKSDAAKLQDIEAVFSEARSTHAQLEDEFRAELRERLTKARKRAFAAPTIPGSDKALQLVAYRSALDRVEQTRDARELSELLERAEVTGDHALARAVLYRGYTLQNEGLVQGYFQRHADELPTWEAFMSAAQEHNTLEERGVTLATGVPAPDRARELGRQFAVTEAPQR